MSYTWYSKSPTYFSKGKTLEYSTRETTFQDWESDATFVSETEKELETETLGSRIKEDHVYPQLKKKKNSKYNKVTSKKTATSVEPEPVLRLRGGGTSASDDDMEKEEEENTNQVTNESKFFRCQIEIENEMKKGPGVSRRYLGNLRSTNQYAVLKNQYLVLQDCDHGSNFKPKKPQNMVFTKMMTCKTNEGSSQNIAVCQKCNSKDIVKALISLIGPEQIISQDFRKNNIKNCIHASVSEILWTKENVEKAENEASSCTILENTEKQHISACFDGKTHGLVAVNIAKKGSKGKCHFCNSVRCTHIVEWNSELKQKVLPSKNKTEKGHEKNVEHGNELGPESDEDNEEGHGEDSKEDDPIDEETKIKLRFPLTKSTQDMMRKADGKLYDHKVNFYTHTVEGLCCIEHGNQWDPRCPIENNWIYSENVKIAHSTFVERQPRKMYFCPTVSKCKCRLGYDGEEDMLFVFGCSPKIQKGKKITSLVSLSLLFDYCLEFFETGQTMRGFYGTYKSKCLKKYGMEESEIIT